MTTDRPDESTADARDAIAATLAAGRDDVPSPESARAAAARVHEAWAAGAARWQGVALPLELFVVHVAERLAKSGDLEAALGGTELEDLYLAAGCARGDAAALREFERAYFDDVRRAHRRARLAHVQEADLAQQVRERLFVAAPGGRPGIAEYSGRATLRAWLRVVLTRLTINAATRGPRDRPAAAGDDEAALDFESAADDPELAHMKSLYRSEFRQAFAEAFDQLPVNDRALLRQRFKLRAGLEELGREYGVHVNTIVRWVNRARAALEVALRASLAARLKLEDSQLTSVFRLVQSRLDVTFGPADVPAAHDPQPPQD